MSRAVLKADPKQHTPLDERVVFFVAGKPEPAGSKNAFPLKNRYTGQWLHDASGRPIVNVVDDNPKSKDWKKTVAARAREVFHAFPTTDPLVVWLTFFVVRPLGHMGTGRNAGMIKDSAPQYPDVKPDVLKLSRAVEDALTGIVWVDDAQIIEEHIRKKYNVTPGVEVRVESLAKDSRQGTLFETRW